MSTYRLPNLCGRVGTSGPATRGRGGGELGGALFGEAPAIDLLQPGENPVGLESSAPSAPLARSAMAARAATRITEAREREETAGALSILLLAGEHPKIWR